MQKFSRTLSKAFEKFINGYGDVGALVLHRFLKQYGCAPNPFSLKFFAGVWGRLFKKAPTLFPERAPFYIHHVVRVTLHGLAGRHDHLLAFDLVQQIFPARTVQLG